MSCFVMQDRALATIAETVSAVCNMGFNYFGFDVPRSLADAVESCRDRYGYCKEEKLYTALYALNVRAYAGRYNRPEDLTAPAYSPAKLIEPRECVDHHEKIKPWHYQLAKLLDCYLYQTAEDATTEDPMRKGLADLLRTLQAFIVRNSNEYHSAAEWGCI